MLYTETDVMDYIEQEDVKFIRLVFTDMFGLHLNHAQGTAEGLPKRHFV